MLAPSLCVSCGHPCDMTQWVVEQGEVVIRHMWCSGCDGPSLIPSASFIDRRTASLPSIASASISKTQVHPSSSSSTMVLETMGSLDDASIANG